jgi:uncharacterized protein (DUF1330 family)
MAAYAVAHLRELSVNREVVAYLNQIDATLDPFEGQFLVHGKQSEVVEGEFPGYIIIIQFPDMENARGWYHSDAYQEIVSLRTNNCEGSVILVDGVPENYQASDLLSR